MYAWGGPVGYPSEIDPSTTGFNPDYYTMVTEGLLYFPKLGEFQFRDGNDDVTSFQIKDEQIIYDNSWTSFDGAANGGGGQGSFTNLEAGVWRDFRAIMAEGGGGDNAAMYWDYDHTSNTVGGNPDFTHTPTSLGLGALVPENYLRTPGDSVTQSWLGRSTWFSDPTPFGQGGRQFDASVRTQTANASHDVRGWYGGNRWSYPGQSLQESWYDTPSGDPARPGDQPAYNFTATDNDANNGVEHSLSVHFGNTGEGDSSFVSLGREEFGIAQQGTSATYEIRSVDGSPLTGMATLNLNIGASFDFNFTVPEDYVENPDFPRDVNSAEASFDHRWHFDTDLDNDGVPDNEFFPISFGGPFVDVRDGFDSWVPFFGVTRNVVPHSSVENTGGNTVVNVGYDFEEEAPFDLDLDAIDPDGDGVGQFNIIGNFYAGQSISNGLDPSRAGPSGDTESIFDGGGTWSSVVDSPDPAYNITLFDGSNGGGGDPPPPAPDPVAFREPYMPTTDGKRFTASTLAGTINDTVEDGSKGDGVVSAEIIKFGGVCYAADEIPFLNAQTGEVPGDNVSFPNLTMITASGPGKRAGAWEETQADRRDGATWALVTASKPGTTIQDVHDAANAEALQLGVRTAKNGEKIDLTETPQVSGDATRTLGGESSTHLFIYAGRPEPTNLKHFDIILDNWARSGDAPPNTTITGLWGNSTHNQVINDVPVKVLPATLENVATTWQTIGDLVDDGPDEQIIIYQLDHADLAHNVENPPDVRGADAGIPGLEQYSIGIPNDAYSAALVNAFQEGKPVPNEVTFDVITAQPLSELVLAQVSVAIDGGAGFLDLGTLDTATQEPFVLPGGQAANRFEFDVPWDFLDLPDASAPLDSVTDQTFQITNVGQNEMQIDRIGLALGSIGLLNLDLLLSGKDYTATATPNLNLEPEEGPTMEADVTGTGVGVDTTEFSVALETLGHSPQNGKVFVVLGDGSGALAGITFTDGDGLLDSLDNPAFDVKAEVKDKNGEHANDSIVGDVGLVLSLDESGLVRFTIEGDGSAALDLDGIDISLAVPFDKDHLKGTAQEPLMMEIQVGEDGLNEFLGIQGFPLNNDEFDGVVLSAKLSQVESFGSQVIPEPATMVTLGSCIICWVVASFKRRRLDVS